MLVHVFGPVVAQRRAGARRANAPPAISNAARAKVRWFLSVDRRDLPAEAGREQTSYRSIMVDGETVEFSDGFTDLHTSSYQEILAGRGFGLDEVRPSIEIVSALRTGTPSNRSAASRIPMRDRDERLARGPAVSRRLDP